MVINKDIYTIDIENDVIAFAEQEGDILRSAYQLAHIEHSKNIVPLLQKDDDRFEQLAIRVQEMAGHDEQKAELLNRYLNNIHGHIEGHTSTPLSAPFDTIVRIKDGDIVTSSKRVGVPEVQVGIVRQTSFEEQDLYTTYNFYERLQTIEREHNPIYDANTAATFLSALLLVLPFAYVNYAGMFVLIAACISWAVFERVPYRREKKLAYVKDFFKSLGKIGFSIVAFVSFAMLGMLFTKPFFVLGIVMLFLGKIRGEI